jgi:hypothetical protein
MAESKSDRRGQKPDDDEEVGGFNPEPRRKREHEQVGPAPTDDPDHAGDEMKRKVVEKITRLPPG